MPDDTPEPPPDDTRKAKPRRRPCNRPRLNPPAWDRNRTRTESVKVRFSPEEFLVAREASRHYRLSIATLMRHALLVLGYEIDPRYAATAKEAIEWRRLSNAQRRSAKERALVPRDPPK